MKPKKSNTQQVRWGALAVWVALLSGLSLAWSHTDLSPLDVIQRLATYGDAWWAPPAFLFLFIFRTVTLFSSAAFAILAGAVFGAPLGAAYTMFGALVSALFGHALGRYFDLRPWLSERPKLGSFMEKARDKGFKTVLVAHLLLLPYDVVNIAAGSVGVGRAHLQKGAMAGSAPAFLSFVFIGASSGLSQGALDLRPTPLIVGTLLLLGSVGLSEYLGRKKGCTVHALS